MCIEHAKKCLPPIQGDEFVKQANFFVFPGTCIYLNCLNLPICCNKMAKQLPFQLLGMALLGSDFNSFCPCSDSSGTLGGARSVTTTALGPTPYFTSEAQLG